MAIDKVTSAAITTDAVGPTQLNEAANYAFTGTVTGAGGVNTPAFEAYLSSNQSISDATETKVAFNIERFDSDSAYDNSSNYRFTIPSGKNGKYFIYSNVQVTSSANSLASGYIMIKKNGSEYMRNAFNPENSSMQDFTPTIVSVIDLVATDYIEIFGLASLASGSPSFSANVKSTFFGAYKIIE